MNMLLYQSVIFCPIMKTFTLTRITVITTLPLLATTSPQPWPPLQENRRGINNFQRFFSELERKINPRVLEENQQGIQTFKNSFKNAAFSAGALRTDYSRNIPDRHKQGRFDDPDDVFTSHQYHNNQDSFSFTIIENKSQNHPPSHSFSYFSSSGNTGTHHTYYTTKHLQSSSLEPEMVTAAQDTPDEGENSLVEITTISNSEELEPETVSFDEGVLQSVDPPPVIEQVTAAVVLSQDI